MLRCVFLRLLVCPLTVALALFTFTAAPPLTAEEPAPAAAPADAADEPADDAAAPDAAPQADAAAEDDKRKDEDYYELLKLFADALDQVDRNYVKEVDRRELIQAAVEGLLSKLDPYSNYIPPDELEQFRSGVESEFGGIGIQVTIEDGQLKIISPLVGTPAYRAGLMAGDHIIRIEGEGTKGISLDEAIRRLKGKVGTTVTFTVMRPYDNSVKTVTLTRENIQVKTVLGDRLKGDDSWDFMYDEEKKIGYIRLTAFSRHTAEELKAALDELTAAGMKGLILDLRFNPGGLLSAAIEIADLFVSEGRIVSTEGRNTPRRAWDAHKTGTYEGFPMAVLVNRFSASAAEITAACLQDHGRAVIIGERTWGKGSVQNIIELEGGRSALKLTTAGYQRPSGKNIHRFEGAPETDDWGVRPDEGFAIALTPQQLKELLDYQRQQAIVPARPGRSLNDADDENAAEEEAPADDPDEPPAGGPSDAPADQPTDDTSGPSGDPPTDCPAEEPVTEPAAEETEPAGESPDAPAPSGDARYVDRQMRKALEYLAEKLGDAPADGDAPQHQQEKDPQVATPGEVPAGAAL